MGTCKNYDVRLNPVIIDVFLDIKGVVYVVFNEARLSIVEATSFIREIEVVINGD